MAGDRALVLGGGGVAGIAWMNGVLVGLGDAGVDVRDADLLIGTSAGANVAAQFASDLSREELYRRQIDPQAQSRELMPPGDPFADLAPIWAEIIAETEGNPAEARRRVGAVALATRSVPEAARRAVVETRLPDHNWPNRRLMVVAVDAETGEPRIFDRDSGVPLVDAVTASSAVPGVWPVASINGIRYTDGGTRSPTNADFAMGCDRVLIITPSTAPPLNQEITDLTARGTRVELIAPDDTSLTAFGDNPLDPATRIPSAKAGRAQGETEAVRIAALWL